MKGMSVKIKEYVNIPANIRGRYAIVLTTVVQYGYDYYVVLAGKTSFLLKEEEFEIIWPPL